MQVANSTFGRTDCDVEVRAAEFVITHVVDVLGQVLKHLEQLLALGFVAGPGLIDGVDHAKHRALARFPLAELRKGRASVGERQLGAQPRDRHHRRQAEATAQSERAVDRAIARGAPPTDAATDCALERHLAKPRADLTGRRPDDDVLRAVVRILGRTRARRNARELERDQRTAEREERRPQRSLDLIKRSGGLASRDRVRFV